MITEQENVVIEQKKNQKKDRQRLEALWWATALIWAGLIFGADSLGLLPQFGQADAWSWVFLGAGNTCKRWEMSTVWPGQTRRTRQPGIGFGAGSF